MIDKLGKDVFCHNFERKILERGAEISAGKELAFFTLNQYEDNIIRAIKSLYHSRILIDGFTKTVKHEIKNKKLNFVLPC